MAGSMTVHATKPLLHSSLLSALRQKESPVTRELFEAHAGFVLRLVQRLGVRVSDAEDVTQEVFMIVHRRIDDLHSGVAARSWLFGITRRVVANHLRKAKRRIEHVASIDAGVTLDDPAAHLQLARDRERLERALARLDLDKRTVFVLFELEGLEMREIADLVGCPVNTAYSRLYAARDLVQRYVLGTKPEPQP
jgi:RNA polymerase sigma-70 factor (ECF subfamily)